MTAFMCSIRRENIGSVENLCDYVAGAAGNIE